MVDMPRHHRAHWGFQSEMDEAHRRAHEDHRALRDLMATFTRIIPASGTTTTPGAVGGNRQDGFVPITGCQDLFIPHAQ
jgi:hypothetical protein